MNIKTIYLDLDGVIANLDEKFASILGISIKEFNDLVEKENRIQRFIHNNYSYNHIINLLYTHLESEKIFETLNTYPRVEYLYNTLYSLKNKHNIKIEILSSITDTELKDSIKQQKLNWLKNQPVLLELVDNSCLFSEGGRVKSNWANNSSLLLDDTNKNIAAFIKNGGFAYRHIDIPSTIDFLDRLSTV